ncbi:IclR family transcriptional regulator [Streptomyces clavifer]|uniref:IclR family transcriptional regulator n=1 Tax=Streptomyces clavifer TaxID=68188 RepID=UPI0036649376
MGDRTGPTLSSVQQALRLMEAAGAHEDGAPAPQLAREAGLPRDSALHLLRALAQDGYLRELDDGVFVLGDKLYSSHQDVDGHGLLDRVRPVLASLRDDVASAAYLTFYEEGEIRIAEIVDSPKAPRVDLWVAFKDAGHATALGKCVLRELDREARADYFSRHTLADLTPRTITHREELVRQLDSAPPAQVVMDREEYALGTVCVAVPVYGGSQMGSLGVSFRSDRMYRTGDLHRRVLAAADRVTRGLWLAD